MPVMVGSGAWALEGVGFGLSSAAKVVVAVVVVGRGLVCERLDLRGMVGGGLCARRRES